MGPVLDNIVLENVTGRLKGIVWRAIDVPTEDVMDVRNRVNVEEYSFSRVFTQRLGISSSRRGEFAGAPEAG